MKEFTYLKLNMSLNINIQNLTDTDNSDERSLKKYKSENSSPVSSPSVYETNTPTPVTNLSIKIPIDKRKQILKKVPHKCNMNCVKNCTRQFQNHACGQEDCDGKCGYLMCGCSEICTEH
jgi:hypothetical protein